MSNYIYESKTINKCRKPKWCSNESCRKTINIGESSITITAFQGEFTSYDVCSKKCEDQFVEDFNKEEENEDS